MNVKLWATHFLVGRQPTFVRQVVTWRLFSMMSSLSPDYDDRAKANNFASPDDVVAALKQPGTIVLDVRTNEEIAEAKLETIDGVQWMTTGCTPMECPGLAADAAKFVKDKDTTVVIHCASGVRANRAKITLENQGYTNVLNGGGLKDILAYLDKTKSGSA